MIDIRCWHPYSLQQSSPVMFKKVDKFFSKVPSVGHHTIRKGNFTQRDFGTFQGRAGEDKRRKHLIENYQCLQADFRDQDYEKKNEDIKTYTDIFLKDVQLLNPDVVFMENIMERHFYMEMKSGMRSRGYIGQIEDKKKGRGMGIFIRKDLLDTMTKRLPTVYRSRYPDPR